MDIPINAVSDPEPSLEFGHQSQVQMHAFTNLNNTPIHGQLATSTHENVINSPYDNDSEVSFLS